MASQNPCMPEGEPSGERILIADDEDIIREMLFAYLTEEGHVVDTAKDGVEAIRKIGETTYSVIITDIRLPGANGMEVLRAAKQVSPTSEIVVMTAFSTEDLAIEAVRLGAYDYLKKPVDDVGLFALLVRQILQKQALARQNQKLVEDLRRKNSELNNANSKLMSMATTDPLTGVYNRRYILARLEQQFQQSARYGETFALLMLDLDHFKRVNDTYGHQVGDDVLKHFVACVRRTIRTTDLFGRYGGEEFMLLLHATDAEGARVSGERVRREIANCPLETPEGAIALTVSIGAAIAPAACVQAPEDMVRVADAALYRAKSEGRNRVVLEESCLAEAAEA